MVGVLEQKKINFGEILVLVGDADFVGNWCVKDAKRLHWSEDNVWATDVQIPPNCKLEYKYVKIVDGSEEILDWSPEENLQLSMPDKSLEGKMIVS